VFMVLKPIILVIMISVLVLPTQQIAFQKNLRAKRVSHVHAAWPSDEGRLRLSYKPYFCVSLFFSHKKLANNTFSHNFSNNRIYSLTDR
jgi:hypothetical protein